MESLKKITICLLLFLLLLANIIVARETDEQELLRLSKEFEEEFKREKAEAERVAKEKGWIIQEVTPDGTIIELQAIDEFGMPEYYITNNLDAAKTVGTNELWTGGSTGLNLTGNGFLLGEWDGGGVLTTHQEFQTNRVTQKDSPGGTHSHSTHVAGTIIASGIDAAAKGMAYQADLDAYDWNSDEAEMATAAAAGLLLSNHSYGSIRGWYYSSSSEDWYWYGTPSISATEDYKFGFYDSNAEDWDEIAYYAPDYLIVKSAGNDRNDNHSGGHYYWDGYSWVWSTAYRDPDGGTTGYDCIPNKGNAKNLLTVGAVEDIPGGYSLPSDVVMTSFSGWGPCDDGRIKPDIVGNGYYLYSCDNANNSAYTTMSGTSMSAPNVTGTLGLLQDYYNQLNLTYMKAATLKALVINSASEAGSNDGPDYEFGWGLLNAEDATEIITEYSTGTGNSFIVEDHLSNYTSHPYTYCSIGTNDIKATLCWTDPPGTPPSASLDPSDVMLVNDLDLRILEGGTTYYPWILDKNNPSNSATTGDNIVDNVEQVVVASPSVGTIYTVMVTHKGNIGAGQDFSLIISQLIDTVFVEDIDFGDAPSPYPTRLADNGASHIIDTLVYLGVYIDGEPDGLQSPDALGDDWNNLDDEDGVVFTSILVPGYTAYVTVNASVPGVLNAWVDFNGNGDWAGSAEQIFNNTSLSAGDNNLSFSVPASAVVCTTFARFRFNTTGGLTYTGQASNGEVEDYQVVIHEPIEDSKMHFPQWPDPSGWDVNCTEPNLIADDWTCIESGPVTDIHFWVSWFTGDGYYGLIDSIHISIHDNIPAPPYSMPGPLLWQRNFKQGEFGYEEFWDYGLQGWYDPVQGIVIPGDHEYFDLINLTNIPDPFYQVEGTIYWLDVSIFINPDYPGYQLGWKTSQHHWEDDAVYLYDVWQELLDPLTEESLDMAFVITGAPVTEELDLGDAPDSPTAPLYRTLLANDGARHTIVPGIFLGNSIDAEADGQPHCSAIGDDNNPAPNDEDGVVFTSTLVPGSTASVTVTASVPGQLNAWVDFDGGGWHTADEHIFTDTPLNPGTNPLTFAVPSSAILGTTFARFRFCSIISGLDFYGQAPDGEVEDYLIEISADSCKMHFVQWPDLTTNGVDVLAMQDTIYIDGEILADDFFCTESGYITDIHIWASWTDDYFEEGNMPPFTLGIWSDQPAGLEFSQPDSLLWEMTFGPTEYEWMLYAETDGEWFYYPCWGYQIFPGDSLVFQFTFYIEEDEAFIQQDSTIYWLSVVTSKGLGYDPIFGWKSSFLHWNDDAVWSPISTIPGYSWNELIYPQDHPLYPESMDLAFFISSTPVPEPELDFGDTPDDASTMTYPTTLANNGARHVVDYVTFLGAQIDAEADGWQSPDALGDDTHDLPDEDGVIFKPIITGSPAQVIVTTSVPGYLQGWMDFNQNGDWIDTNEQIFTDSYIHFASTVCLNYYVPATADTGYTFARFRFSTNPGLADSGLAQDGEVEDYMVHIGDSSNVKWSQLPCEELPGLHCHDYEIPPDPYDAITIADDWLCNGGLVTDIHWWGNYEVDASGAEIRGSGINHFHLSIHNNDPAICLPIEPEIGGVDVPFASVNETDTGLLNSEGCKIYLYEYYLDIPFEQIEGEYYWLDICAYSNVPTDYAIWRWQESARSTSSILCTAAEKSLSGGPIWTSITWPTPTPTRYTDMAFEITSEPYVPELDFGDAPDPTYPTLLASNGARHTPDGVTYLGALIDAEPDGWQSITALGDNTHNLDDEDGVTFTCPLIPGEQGAITVTTNSAGVAFFNSWIDFNADGDWSDANEQIFADLPLPAGIKPLNFSVPAGAAIDSTYARFRISTIPGLADTGFAPDGEVEDYRIEISEIPDDDCKMHFHQWPDTTMFGVDVHVTYDYELNRILADDFLCTETGPVSSIHIWGSWKYDCPPPPSFASFQLGIWSDNPNGPNGWSEPAALLWEKMFFPGEYLEEPYYYVPDGEHWYDPCTGYLEFPGDYTVWKYDFTIPNVDAFTQEEGNTYWLSVTAFPEIPDTQFGWKSSVNHWNDDTVFDCMFPSRHNWQELLYPYGHPFYPMSMDMAFYINCEPSTPIVSISVSSDTVYVSWDPIPCADSYTVYSSVDPYAAFPSAWTVEQTGITSTSWCENVSGTTKKFYRVVAIK